MSQIVHTYLAENYPEFHWEIYKGLNKDLLLPSKLDYEAHFLLYGINESRKWKITDLLPDFNWLDYKKLNPQLGTVINSTQKDYELHYLLHGIHKKLPYNQIYNAPNNISDSVYHQIDNTNNLEALKNILIVIPGFGEPYLDLKVSILEKNISTLAKSLSPSIGIRILVFLYTTEKFNYLTNHFKKSPVPVTFLPKKGIVGEFIYKYIDTKLITPFDYLFFILDDIELHTNTNIKEMIKVYTNHHVDILGFPVTTESPTPHDFMRFREEYVKENIKLLKVNFMEFFSYFMNITTFFKYKKFFTEHTYWLWGIDMVLHPCGFNLMRLEHLPVRHYLKNTTYSKNLPDPHIELAAVRSRYPAITEKRVLSAHSL
jgi:hypothetical protein